MGLHRHWGAPANQAQQARSTWHSPWQRTGAGQGQVWPEPGRSNFGQPGLVTTSHSQQEHAEANRRRARRNRNKASRAQTWLSTGSQSHAKSTRASQSMRLSQSEFKMLNHLSGHQDPQCVHHFVHRRSGSYVSLHRKGSSIMGTQTHANESWLY